MKRRGYCTRIRTINGILNQVVNYIIFCLWYYQYKDLKVRGIYELHIKRFS